MSEPATAALTVQIAVVPSPGASPDPAQLNNVAVATVGAVRTAGFAVDTPYTGERGVTVFEVVQQLAVAVYASRDVIIAVHPGEPDSESSAGPTRRCAGAGGAADHGGGDA
jgi:hypothetical protein